MLDQKYVIYNLLFVHFGSSARLTLIWSTVHSRRHELCDPGPDLETTRIPDDFPPIMRLPPEILSQIFIEHLYDTIYIELPPVFPNLSVACVCHQWRKISLQLTQLWATFRVTNQTSDSTLELLSRSKTTPLTLRVEDIDIGDPLMKKITAEFFRLRGLDLALSYDPGDSDFSFWSLPKEAPCLRDLTIRSPWTLAPLTFIDIFDGCALPSLSRLRFFGSLFTPFSTKPIFVQNLVYLVIRLHGSRNKLSSILDCLENASYLQHLDLRLDLDPEPSSLQNSRHVELTSIRYLALEDGASPVPLSTHILPRLGFPPSTTIDLRTFDPYDSWQAGILPLLDRYRNSEDHTTDDYYPSFRSVAISKIPYWFPGRWTIRVAFWTEVLSIDDLLRPKWKFPPRLLIQSIPDVAVLSPPVEEGLKIMFMFAPLLKVETCIITGWSMEKSVQAAFMSGIPEVSTLYLGDMEIDSLCDVLAESHSNPLPQERCKFMWPKLEKMVFENIMWGTDGLAMILEMLENRREATSNHGSISTLRLLACSGIDIAHFTPFGMDVAFHPGPYVRDRLVIDDNW